MFNKIGKLGKEIAASSMSLVEARDYLLMSVEEKLEYAKRKGLPGAGNVPDIPLDYPLFNDNTAANFEVNYNKDAATGAIPRKPKKGNEVESPRHERSEEHIPSVDPIEGCLKPNDVISWISPFDGTGNVRVFIREVDDALSEMHSWAHKKCVLRMVVANRLVGQVKDLVNTQETNTWKEIKELLSNYYDIRDAPYTYLKEQRSKIVQGPGERVQEYARRFLDAHGKVMRAASNRADGSRARYLQETEEEEGVFRFVVGLTDALNQRVEVRAPHSLKEAINLALNAESQVHERYLCRRMAQLRAEEKGRRREDSHYKGDKRSKDARYGGERRRHGPNYSGERQREEPHKEEWKRRDGGAQRTYYSGYKPDYKEREYPSKQKPEAQDFRPRRDNGRPPPVRAIEEANEEDHNFDPYEYMQPEKIDRSSTSVQEESDELYGF